MLIPTRRGRVPRVDPESEIPMTAKKLGALFAAISLAALTACSSSNGTDYEVATSESPSTPTVTSDPATDAPETSQAPTQGEEAVIADVGSPLDQYLFGIAPKDYRNGVKPLFTQHVVDTSKGYLVGADVDSLTLKAAVVLGTGSELEPAGYYVQFYDFSGSTVKPLARVEVPGYSSCQILTADLATCKSTEQDGAAVFKNRSYFVNMATGEITNLAKEGQGSLLHVKSEANGHTFFWFDPDGRASIVEFDDAGKVLRETPASARASDPTTVPIVARGDGIWIEEWERGILWDRTGNTELTKEAESCATVTDGWACVLFNTKEIVGIDSHGSTVWTHRLGKDQIIGGLTATPSMTLAQVQAGLKTLKTPGDNIGGDIGVTPDLTYFAGGIMGDTPIVYRTEVEPHPSGGVQFDLTNPEVVLLVADDDAIQAGAVLDPVTGKQVTVPLKESRTYYFWDDYFDVIRQPAANLLLSYDLDKGDFSLLIPDTK